MGMELVIKLMGTVLVIGASFLYAKERSDALELKMTQLRQLYGILLQLKSQLKYMNSTLFECFRSLSCHIDAPFSRWLGLLADSMENERDKSFAVIWEDMLSCLMEDSLLDNKDIALLSELKDKLGTADVGEALKAIDYVLIRIEENREVLNNELKGRQKVILSISLFAGAMVVILLM